LIVKRFGAPHQTGSKEQETMDLFQKCREFTRAREVMKLGIYPFFHT
jgi:hypothetical protein